jgi:hypothetical protein
MNSRRIQSINDLAGLIVATCDHMMALRIYRCLSI